MSRNIEETIKKLKQLIKKGYLPSRKFQNYTYFTGFEYGYKSGSAFLVNCFEHACFNLTNEQIYNYLSDRDSDSFCGFYAGSMPDEQKAVKEMQYFIESTGLTIEECDVEDELQKGQSKILIYFKKNIDLDGRDFHLLRQEDDEDGIIIWSDKKGFLGKEVNKHQGLPNDFEIMDADGKYELYGCYKLTNRYAKYKTYNMQKDLKRFKTL